MENVAKLVQAIARAGGHKLTATGIIEQRNGTQANGAYVNLRETAHPLRNIRICVQKYRDRQYQVKINEGSALPSATVGEIHIGQEDRVLEMIAEWAGEVAPESAAEIEAAISAFEMDLSADRGEWNIDPAHG